MSPRRISLVALSGTCIALAVTCAVLGFTGSQGVGIMGLVAGLLLLVGTPGLGVALVEHPRDWTRGVGYAASAALAIGAIAMITLSGTGVNLANMGEFWHVQASVLVLSIASVLIAMVGMATAFVMHANKVVKLNDPLGPLDWSVQSERLRAGVPGRATERDPVLAGRKHSEQTPSPATIAARSGSIARGPEVPAGVSVPDGVLNMPLHVMPPTALGVARSSRMPAAILGVVLMLALLASCGLWWLSRTPESVNAGQAEIGTIETVEFPEWGFGYDIPGAPFERIDPAQFSDKSVLAISRTNPSIRCYVIAEPVSQRRSLQDAVRSLRAAMASTSPEATTLLDNKATLAGIEGWRLLTRVRVGSSDTFYCHWIGSTETTTVQIWVVGGARDAQMFALEADALFNRFYILRKHEALPAEVPGVLDDARPDQATPAQPDAAEAKPAEPKPAAPQPPVIPAGQPRPATTNPGAPKPGEGGQPTQQRQRPRPQPQQEGTPRRAPAQPR